MWFKVLSLILALVCLTKGIVALTFPTRFYERRRQQYASERVPHILLVVSFIVFTILCVAWYATLFHYVTWGWVVTAFVTAVSVLSVGNVLKWSRHRIRMLRIIGHAERKWQVDAGIVALGVCFLILAVFVYPS